MQGYAIVDIPEPRQTLVHIHPDANELGRVYRPSLAIVSGPAAFAAAVARLKPASMPRWKAWTEAAHADYVASLEPTPYNGALDMGRALAALRDELPRDAIVTLDAGNHTGWPQRFLHFGRPRREIGPTSGAMGYCAGTRLWRWEPNWRETMQVRWIKEAPNLLRGLQAVACWKLTPDMKPELVTAGSS